MKAIIIYLSFAFSIILIFLVILIVYFSKKRNRKELYSKEMQYFKNITDNDLQTYYSNNKIIVSITTSPSRILMMEPVIISLLKQTYPPTLIRINIPKIFKRTKENYKIPIFITNNPKIKIFQYEQDYGPIMKFLPTIIDYKNDNNKVIIYGDDDVVFLPKTIETYLKFIIINPNNVYCLSGITYNTLDNWTQPSNTNNIIDKIDIPEGYMSVCCKSNILENTSCIIKYYNIVKENKDCFQSDDLIIGNFFSINNINIYAIKTKDVNFNKWWSSKCELSYGNLNDGLKNMNNGGHKNTYKRVIMFLYEHKLLNNKHIRLINNKI